MKANGFCIRKKKRGSEMSVWTVIGGAALVVAAYGLIHSWKDIARYIKIRSM
jgi:hypothetical protein